MAADKKCYGASPDLGVQHPAHDLPLERLLPEGPLRRRPEEVNGDAGQRILEAVLDRQDSLDRDDRVVDLHVLGVTAHLARLLEPGLVQLIKFWLLILESVTVLGSASLSLVSEEPSVLGGSTGPG